MKAEQTYLIVSELSADVLDSNNGQAAWRSVFPMPAIILLMTVNIGDNTWSVLNEHSTGTLQAVT